MSSLFLQQYTCDQPASINFKIADFMGMWYMQQQSADVYTTLNK